MKKLIFLSAILVIYIIGYSQSIEPFMDDYGNKIQTKSPQTILQPTMDDTWTMLGPFGGDVYDLEVNPLNGDQIYAAAGTPYFSNNAGETWSILSSLTDVATNSIEVIGINYNGIIFAGGTWNYGVVYRSMDGGETFETTNIPGNFGVSSIAFDPFNDSHILLGLADFSSSSTNVIVESVDQGDSWIALNINVIPAGYEIVDVTFDPDENQTIFGVGQAGINDSEAFVSFDGGDSWENISSGLPSGKPFNSVEIASGNVFIGGGQLFGSNFMGLYKSEDYGQSWTDISTSFPKQVVNDLLINPANTDIMYAGTEGDGIYKTTDGGDTWTYETNGPGDDGSVNSVVFKAGNLDALFAGYKSLGVCKSMDGAINWEFANYGIGSLSLNDIAVAPDYSTSDFLIASFEGENSGGCYLSDDLGETWNLVETLPATRFTKVAVSSDNNLFAWSNGPSTVAQEGLYKSTDGGITWYNMGPNLGTYFETEIWALYISLSDPNLIYIGGNNFGVAGWEEIIYKTTDGAETWELVYEGPENFKIQSIYFDNNESDPETIFAADYNSYNTGGGGFLMGSANGHYWESINNGIPTSTNYCGAICFNDFSDRLYGGVGGNMGTSGSVYTSDDNGDTWNLASLSLGTTNKIVSITNALSIDGQFVLVAVNNGGMYINQIPDSEWLSFNDGLTTLNINSISESHSIGDGFYHYIATQAGAFRTYFHFESIEEDLHPMNNLIINPNPGRGFVNISSGKGFNDASALSIYDINGKCIKEIKGLELNSKKEQIKIELDAGTYFAVFKTETTISSKKIIILN